MGKHFIYSKTVQALKVDDQGSPIPLKNDKDEVIKGKFETEDKILKDSFNSDYVLRTYAKSDNEVIVLLDDGHEETHKMQAIEKNKIVEKNQRSWLQSEIQLQGEDVQRWYTFLETL